jgi:hypothetical protein
MSEADQPAQAGMVFLCEIPDGAKVKVLRDGTVLVAHPDHPPFKVNPDGTKEEISP